MKYVIVDLDGTLANVDHRVNLVRRKKKWFDKFYELCVKDKVNAWCRELILSMVAQGVGVHIVSARPYALREKTLWWLENVAMIPLSVSLHLLRMDGKEAFVPDVDLKRKWLKERFFASGLDKKDVLFVVDDRKRVVDMWREEGLVCLQCYDWPEFK